MLRLLAAIYFGIYVFFMGSIDFMSPWQYYCMSSTGKGVACFQVGQTSSRDLLETVTWESCARFVKPRVGFHMRSWEPRPLGGKVLYFAVLLIAESYLKNYAKRTKTIQKPQVLP